MAEVLWTDKKRPIFGLPLSFTKYTLTEEKLTIRTGMLSIKEEDIQLYRITDITLKRTFWQRIFGVGTLHCCSGDRTTPEFDVKDIKDSENIKEKMSKLVEERRDQKGIVGHEIMNDKPGDHEVI